MIIWSTLFTWLKVWKTAIVMYRITRQPYWIKPRGLITSHDAYRTFVIAYMTAIMAIFAILSKDTEEVIIWPHYFTTLGETQRRWFLLRFTILGKTVEKWVLVTNYIEPKCGKLLHSESERSVSALKTGPSRWVKYSPIFGSNLAPLNQGQYSPIS